MTWKQMYEREPKIRWYKRVLIIDFVHCIRLLRNPKHRIEDTARYFGISKSLCCENMLLAKAIKLDESLETKSRTVALIAMRRSPKQQPSA